jgi:hypothetical protein
MDFLGALSGLERIAIIGGAMLVGYWGYRMFASDRTPALVFMGIACTVLFGALFTGGSHLQNVGASYQLATASATNAATASEAAAAELPPPGEAEEADVVDPIIAPTVPLSHQETLDPAPLIAAPAQETADALPAPAVAALEQVAMATPAANEIQDLLSSLELGGRIVSVKSDAVTLEWSPAER